MTSGVRAAQDAAISEDRKCQNFAPNFHSFLKTLFQQLILEPRQIYTCTKISYKKITKTSEIENYKNK